MNEQAMRDDDRITKERFEQACAALPEGVSWGDNITPDIVRNILDFACRADAVSAPSPISGIRKWNCQNGGDVCLAGNIDGVCCADDCCDIDDGVRKAPVGVSPVGASEDDMIGLAVALEQRRALAIVAAVRALRLGKGTDPMMPTVAESHFDLACEEIEIRLRTEQWTLDGVDMPLPTSQVPPAVKAFGKGDQVVIYGLFDGSPAVVIYPAEQPGEVGASAQREKASVDANLTNAMVLTFPTVEQAQRVSDALVNDPAAQQSVSPLSPIGDHDVLQFPLPEGGRVYVYMPKATAPESLEMLAEMLLSMEQRKSLAAIAGEGKSSSVTQRTHGDK